MTDEEPAERLLKLGFYMIENGFPKDEMDAAINAIKVVQITNALAKSRQRRMNNDR